MILELEDGIYYDLPRLEYDQLTTRVNWSTLKHFGRSPAHYKHAISTIDGDDTDARLRGRCVHLAVLEPDRFRAEVVVYDAIKRGKLWEAFQARHAGKEILSDTMHESVISIAASVRASAMAQPFLADGRAEVTVLWTLTVPDHGPLLGYSIRCKARLDFVNARGLTDLKSAKDASPVGFGKGAANYEMHVQAAWYRDGWQTVTGEERPYFLVATEAIAPFVTQVYEVPIELLEHGRSIYSNYVAHLNLCRREDRYGGYADAPMMLELPRWAMPREDEV